MSPPLLSAILLHLIFMIPAATLLHRFSGSVQSDGITYVSFVIPPRAEQTLRITVFLDHIKRNYDELSVPSPFVLVRYDGLPTPTRYDEIHPLPALPYALDIYDDAPTAATVYIGIWGGDLLNSLVYFAGDAQEIAWSVEVELEQCGSPLMRGEQCGEERIDSLGAAERGVVSEMALTSSAQKRDVAIPVQPGLEAMRISVDPSGNFACSKSASKTSLLSLHLFQSQPNEGDAVSASFNPCSTSQKGAVLSLPYPRAGLWTLRLELASSPPSLPPAANTTSGQRRSRLRFTRILRSSVDARRALKPSSQKGPKASQETQHQLLSLRLNSSYSVCPTGLTTSATSLASLATTSCDTQIDDMVSDRDSMVLRSLDTTLKAPLQSAFFRAEQISDASRGAILGGFLVVQLRIRFEQSSNLDKDALLSRLKALPLELAFRCGGLAAAGPSTRPTLRLLSSDAVTINLADARSSLSKDDGIQLKKSQNSLDKLSQLLGLSPVGPPGRFLDSVGGDDGDDGGPIQTPYPGVMLSWTLPKPALEGLSQNSPLSVRVSTQSQLQTKLVLSLSLLAQSCTESSCSGHGECVVYEGAVAHSGCACRYPYSGEKCELMSLSLDDYHTRLAFLLCSNAAMLFGIWLCASCNMRVMAVVLLLSSLSSVAYHACDLDLQCFSFSFRSLQTFDICFSTLSVASLIIHYSPGNAETHATMMMLVLGLLLPPIATEPTALINIFFGIGLGAAMCACVWLYALMGCGAWSWSWCCGCGTTTRRRALRPGPAATSLLELVSTRLASSKQQRFRALRTSESATGEGADDDEEDDGEAEAGEEGEGDDGEDGGEAEEGGEWSSTPVSSSSSSSAAEKSTPSKSDRGPRAVAAVRSCCSALFATACEFFWSLLGLLLALFGIIAFATQTRLNYHVNHSAWHLFVMLSSYPLVRGRGAVVKKLCASLGIELLGPAAKGRPGY